MRIPRFELDRWMETYHARPLLFDLSASTGPVWTVEEVLALDGADPGSLADLPVTYSEISGPEDLREAIVGAYGGRPEHVQVTTGASEATALLMATHARPGGNVLVPDPGFFPFTTLAGIFGLEVRPYALDRDHGFRIDPEALVRLADRDTVLVIVNSPHNPTGACLEADERLHLEQACQRVGATLVIDEVYAPIWHGARDPGRTSASHVIRVGGMSKAMSLAGTRVGWIIDPDGARRESYFDLRAYLTLGGSPIAERLATVALRHHGRVVERAREVATLNLAALEAFVDGQERMAWVRPRGGLVAFPWFTDTSDARPRCTAMAERGLLLAPGDCFGRPEHVRIGLGSPAPEAFEEALMMMSVLLDEVATATARP